MKWEKFLDDPIHHNLYVSALVYMPTIKVIRRLAEPGDQTLEAGCGSSRTAILLTDMGYRVIALDKSLALLNRISPVTAFFSGLRLINAENLHIPFRKKCFKVVYSCGVLEHFEPSEIVKFLKGQRKVSTYVLVDVPNDGYVKKCFGDEKYYFDEKWNNMFDEAGLAIKKVIHRGLDMGEYVGNCSIFLAVDENDKLKVKEKIDVYDYY